MKTLLICVFVAGAALVGDPTDTDPADILKSDGVLVISDGSSLYEFRGDGRFHSHPVGVDGRLLDGTWTSGDNMGSMVFTATAKMTWANGYQPKGEYRRIVFVVYPGRKRSPDKRSFGELRHKGIFDCYFLIQELTKIPKPDETGAVELTFLVSARHEVDISGAREYRFKILTGTPSTNAAFMNTEEVVLCKTVTTNEPFSFQDGRTQASGTLFKTREGTLRFTGRVRVGNTTADYDKDVIVGEGYRPKSAAMSGYIQPFFIRFEEIEAELRETPRVEPATGLHSPEDKRESQR